MTLFQTQNQVGHDYDPLKLVIDENLSPIAVRALLPLIAACRDNAEITSVTDKRSIWGRLDQQWIPRASEENWMIIAGDRGKSNRGAKLPLVCSAEGATHVLISNKLHHESQWLKMRAIIASWEELRKAQNSVKGARYRLMFDGNRRVRFERHPNDPLLSL
jgi:hypothetical protein